MKRSLLLLLCASAAFAEQPTLEQDKLEITHDCGSVVIIKCDRPPGTPAAEATRYQSRSIEARRQFSPIQQLGGVVIEAEAVRRRSLEEAMASAFSIVRWPRDGNYTFDTGEGSKCTCMNVCPPFPFPCCVCSRR